MAQSPQPGPSSVSGSSSVLQRGKACLTCRRRKMKCDGVRPVCGQCIRAGKPDDCEYTDGQGRSRTQILEERIAILEARIQELETPADEGSSVLLHDPHQSPTPSAHSRSSSHSSIGASQSISHPWNVPTQGETLGGLSLQPLPGSDTSDVEPRLEMIPHFLDLFFRHSSQLGWFLHSSRFRDGALLPSSPPNPNRPIPLLLCTVWLWAAIFSRLNATHEYADREHGLAVRARSLLGVQFSTLTPHQTLQVIQAKELFALYLFTTGQLLEGKQLCDEAVTLALSCGLHKIRSAQPARATNLVESASVLLPDPLDQIEEGERLNGFWTLFSMDRCWAVVLNTPTIISDDDLLGTQIDTPWPLDMETYERGQIYPNLRTSGTLRIFLSGFNTSWPWENQSILALTSKASALFERAARLSSSWRPGIYPYYIHPNNLGPPSFDTSSHFADYDPMYTGSPNVNAFYTEFLSLDQRIEDFKSQLMPLVNVDMTTEFDSLRSLHIVHCLAHAATIQLHSPFADQNQNSRAKSLNAALGIVRAGAESRSYDFICMHPLMAMLWSSASRVIVEEIASLRTYHVGQVLPQPGHELELRNSVEKLVTSISIFAPWSPLMDFQLTKVQQAYAGV